MSKNIGPSDWEVKLCKRLGVDFNTIDESHRYLAKALPFYRKVSLYVFPPIHSSIDLIHSVYTDAQAGENAADPEADQDGAVSEVQKKETDFAKLIDAEGCLMTILNALVATLNPAGLSSLRSVYKKIRDGNNKDDSTDIQNELIDYLESENDTDDDQIDDIDDSAATAESTTKPTATDPSLPEVPLKTKSPKITSQVPIFKPEPPETRIPRELFGPKGLKVNLDISTILSGIRIPPLEARSPWEISFMKNLEFESSDKYKIVDFVENAYDIGYTRQNLDIIKYCMARKLQKCFNLSDDDVLCKKFEAWLVRDVLLQGHIFVTHEAICFYLLLPGKVLNPEDVDPDIALHEGALGHGEFYFSAVNKTTVWAILRPRSLCFYSSPSQLYFPSKVIDLKNALYCQIIEPSSLLPTKSETLKNSKPGSIASPQVQSEASSFVDLQDETEEVLKGTWFKIVCTDKTYKLQAKGIYSARHWVIALTKAIFTLRNTNVHQEAILKVPLEEVLDYHKNYVLVEEESVSENLSEPLDDDDKPLAFTISYNLPVQEINKNLKELHMKTALDAKLLKTVDSVNFLLFQQGRDLVHLVNSVFEAYMKHRAGRSEETIAPGYYKSLSFKKSLKSHKTEIESTLQPEFLSGTSIINKIESVNIEIQKYRQEQYLTLKDGKIVSPHTDELSSIEKESRVMKVLALADRLFAHPPVDSEPVSEPTLPKDCDFDFDDDDTCESFEQVWETNPIVSLPKPFTIQMLKNTGMVISAQRRNIKDVVFKYHTLLINDEEDEQTSKESSDSVSSLTSIDDDASVTKTKKGSTRLKLLKRSFKTVSTMGGLWSAGPEHFGPNLIGDAYYVTEVGDRVKAVDRFRKYFSLGPESILIASYFAHLRRSVPIYGRLYIGNDKLYFRSLLPGVSTQMVLPLKSIQLCHKGKLKESHYFREAIRVKGMNEVLFEFGSNQIRNDFHCVLRKQLEEEILESEDPISNSAGSEFALKPQESSLDPDRFHRSRIRTAKLRLFEDKVSVACGIDFPLIIEDNPIFFSEVMTSKPYNIVLLTIGSRGDVQPYIALGKELLREGHDVTIATHSEFKKWIELHGITHKEIAGDPAELMQLMVTHGSLSVAFLKEAHVKFREWISSLLETSWLACQGADLIIESPSTMSGIHIAEALGIPYMRAFTMPWTRTKAYPHAFIVPEQKRGGSYNLMTHVIFENVFWKGISSQVNAWRVKHLGLPRTNLANIQQSRIPFLYNVSPSIFPPAIDFPDWVKVTGYWFLNEGSGDYQPPTELVNFLNRARKRRKKIVYVGFGSIVVSDANGLTRTIVETIKGMDVMCILNKGWSDRLSKEDSSPPVELPPEVFDIGTVPHDWLFTRVDVAVHHGGSGTTGASLRAGLPTIIKPFFGDQFFYASRVEELGVGVGLRTLNQKTFTKALEVVLNDDNFKVKAQEIANSMNKERGVLSAVEAIYTEMAYAKSLVLNIKQKTAN